MRYLSKYIRKSWPFHPPCKTLSWSKHRILLIHSKKRCAVQPIPIQVDRFSKLIPRHLAKVDTTGRREGEGEGFPEFWASFCIISIIFFFGFVRQSSCSSKIFLETQPQGSCHQVASGAVGLGRLVHDLCDPSVVHHLEPGARERMMSLRMKPRFSEYLYVAK